MYELLRNHIAQSYSCVTSNQPHSSPYFSFTCFESYSYNEVDVRTLAVL